MNQQHCDDCDHDSCVEKVSIFARLTSDELAPIHALVKRRRVAKGVAIFRVGDPSDTLFIVNTGTVKVTRNDADGREHILHLFGEGDTLGETALLKAAAHVNDAVALTDAELCTIAKGDFDAYLMAHPSLALRLLEVIGERMQRLEDLVESLGNPDAERRLRRLLRDWARQLGQRDQGVIVLRLPLSREDMAQYLGVTRETVSRKLGRLQDAGVIRLISTREIAVLDEAALEGED